MDEEKKEVFLTKYSLTKGKIKRASKTIHDDNDNKGPYLIGFQLLRYKHKEFAFTESEAMEFAEHLRKKKIWLLQKQITKLESLAFTVI